MINRLYQEGDILTKGAHEYAPNKNHAKGGLNNEEFHTEFGGQPLTVNGLDLAVNNHQPGARYMAAGKLDSLAYPTFAALVAACRGPECPLAFLTFGNDSATANVVPMSRVPYLPSLQAIADADAVGGNPPSPYLGAGIKGNRVVGATDGKQFAVPLDPATLPPDAAKGVKVRPEHAHQALRELAGIADHPLAKKFPLGVAEAERLRGFWG